MTKKELLQHVGKVSFLVSTSHPGPTEVVLEYQDKVFSITFPGGRKIEVKPKDLIWSHLGYLYERPRRIRPIRPFLSRQL